MEGSDAEGSDEDEDFKPAADWIKVTKPHMRRGRNDGAHIVVHGSIKKEKHTRARSKLEAVHRAVDFLFLTENIDQISWSAKKIEVDGIVRVMPGLARRVVCLQLPLPTLRSTHAP